MMFKNQSDWDRMAQMEYLVDRVSITENNPFAKHVAWDDLSEEEKNKYRSKVLKG